MKKVGMMMYFHIFGFLVWFFFVPFVGGNFFRKIF